MYAYMSCPLLKADSLREAKNRLYYQGRSEAECFWPSNRFSMSTWLFSLIPLKTDYSNQFQLQCLNNGCLSVCTNTTHTTFVEIGNLWISLVSLVAQYFEFLSGDGGGGFTHMWFKVRTGVGTKKLTVSTLQKTNSANYVSSLIFRFHCFLRQYFLIHSV